MKCITSRCIAWLLIGVFFISVAAGLSWYVYHAPSSQDADMGLISESKLRLPYEGCRWERVAGAGLEFWGQYCVFPERTVHVGISESLPGAVIEELAATGPVAIGDAIQVFDLPNKKIEDVYTYLRDREDWKDADACVFRSYGPTQIAGIRRYVLMPSGDALKRFEEEGKLEPIPHTCAGYGMGNSGVYFFEIHDSNPGKALFLSVGQELPLFEENTIVVR